MMEMLYQTDKDLITVEIWKDIVGLKGYKISTQGRIKSFFKNKNGYIRKQKIDRKGRLCINIQGKNRYIHLLVLTSFIGPRPIGYEGCHKDDNPLNNNLENLYWGTPEQNLKDKIKNGKTTRGDKQPTSKLKEVDIPIIRNRARQGETCRAIAKSYNVSIKTIHNAIIGNTFFYIEGVLPKREIFNLEINGISKNISDWSYILNIPYVTMCYWFTNKGKEITINKVINRYEKELNEKLSIVCSLPVLD